MRRFIYLFCCIVGAACDKIYLIHTQKNKQTNENKNENRKFQPRQVPQFASYWLRPCIVQMWINSTMNSSLFDLSESWNQLWNLPAAWIQLTCWFTKSYALNGIWSCVNQSFPFVIPFFVNYDISAKWYMKCFIYGTADFEIKWAMIIAVVNAI